MAYVGNWVLGQCLDRAGPGFCSSSQGFSDTCDHCLPRSLCIRGGWSRKVRTGSCGPVGSMCFCSPKTDVVLCSNKTTSSSPQVFPGSTLLPTFLFIFSHGGNFRTVLFVSNPAPTFWVIPSALLCFDQQELQSAPATQAQPLPPYLAVSGRCSLASYSLRVLKGRPKSLVH